MIESARFFILEASGGVFGTKWAYADQVDPVHIGNAELCPVCERAISMLEWLPPHRINLSSAKPEKWGDFLWGAGITLMVSDRFRAIYEQQGLQGIAEFYPPAEIVRVGTKKQGDLPPGLPVYSEIRLKWNGANLDDVASQVVRHNLVCSFCRGAYTALEKVVLEAKTWDGSDIFRARGLPGVIVVSERFKDVADMFGLKNLWLIPAEQYAYDESRPGLWYVRGATTASSSP